MTRCGTVPETAGVVGVLAVRQLLGEDHLFAVAELLRVVRHPRYRLAVANSDIDVILQPRVGPLQQLAVHNTRRRANEFIIVQRCSVLYTLRPSILGSSPGQTDGRTDDAHQYFSFRTVWTTAVATDARRCESKSHESVKQYVGLEKSMTEIK